MKKIIALVLAMCMVFTLCACGGNKAPDPTEAPVEAEDNEPAEAEKTEEEDKAEEEDKTEEEDKAEEEDKSDAASVDFPTKSLSVIVPYAAGGSADLATRKLCALMEKELGQSITVLNQAGSSGAIGLQACLDAEPDGYTMVMSADSLGTLRVMGLSDEIDYTDYAPIAAVINDPKVFVVKGDSPYETLEDLFNAMKENPGKIKMSYTGPGGSGHVQSLILNALGYEMALTAYSGGSEGLLAVLSDSVDFTNAQYSTVIDYLKSGELKCLGVCGTERISAIPDVPTIVEIYPESEQYMKFPFAPFVLQVSKDVDPAVVEVLRDAAKKAMATDDWNSYVEETCQDKLYEKYTTEDDIYEFLAGFESLVSWMLYDAGATQNSPEDFNIPKP